MAASDIKNLSRRIERDMPRRFRAAAADDLAAAAQAGLTAARRQAPVRTGALRRSIVAYVQPTRVVLESPLPYAGIQEKRHRYLRTGFSAAITTLQERGYRR